MSTDLCRAASELVLPKEKHITYIIRIIILLNRVIHSFNTHANTVTAVLVVFHSIHERTLSFTSLNK